MKYQPSLDGVRAVAVALVLLFHLGLPWLPAGYLGVSVFFTLSGYLITTLLLREFATTSTVSLRGFYSRRARRLLPAASLVLGLVALARWNGEFSLAPRLRADLYGALFDVYNWVQLAGGSSYAALFGAVTSPLEHYWSLSIEEQFYLVWPVTLLWLCRRGARRGGSVLRPVLLLTLAFAAAAPLIAWRWGGDAAYWSTPSRLPELLIGALLAAWLHTRPRVGAGARWWAAPALATILVCSAVLPSGSGPAFSGWLSPFALVSALLLLSLQVPGPITRLLSARPLVAVGRVSYGLYLVHWPVFVLLRRHGWDLTGWRGASLALSVSLALTLVSYWLVERPVRRATWAPRRTAGLAAAGMLVMATVVTVVPVSRGFLEADHATLEAAAIRTDQPMTALRSVSRSTSTTTTATPTTVAVASEVPVPPAPLPLPPAPSRPVRVLVVGDSTAFYVGQGLASWAVAHPQHAQVDLTWCQGCGFILDGTITSFDGAQFVATSRTVVQEWVPQQVAKVHPDVVVLMASIDDMADRSWDMAEGVLTPRDAPFRERMYAQYRALTESLLTMGVPNVVWVVPPVPTSEFEAHDLREADRYERQHDVIRQVAADVVPPPGAAVAVAEMDDWLRGSGHSDDAVWRPDGTHFTEESAAWLADQWFGPWIVTTAVGG